LLKTRRRKKKRPRSWFARLSVRVPGDTEQRQPEKSEGRTSGWPFSGHVEDEFPVPIFHLAQQAAKLVKKACIFADASPGNVIGRLALRKIWQLRRFLTVIKELIEWALESASQLFQRFDGRDSVTILYA